MEKKYTFWERLKSDTPTFFKRMQVFGIGLAGMGTSLSQITGMPVKLTTIIIAIGSTIAVLAQFAVKQYEPLND
ncbi:hypothetical protein GWR56_11115 [Mucilaginibacter sp. 14171R-50]|uniref:hypothetical protein n=1 Tax=Mucilaginibacter sp. 14171R-50 TaxID=2703789 RepID=UPI00138B2F2A|nr:hypothetical protein [Mucilaginibacter sp. 14171R-50]QHS56055.1 hypothetical protein GWR56_11115 [Mucilaginibacter sp. 14171R-50]